MSVFVEVSQYLSKLRGDHLDADGKSQVLNNVTNKLISNSSFKKVFIANKGKDVIKNVMNKHSNHNLIQFYGKQILDIVTKKKESVIKVEKHEDVQIYGKQILDTVTTEKESVMKVEKQYDENDLINAVKDDNYFMVKKIISSGVNVNFYNKFTEGGLSPLQISVNKGNIKIVDLLLTNDANPDLNDTNIWFKCPLRLAVDKGNIKIIKSLIDAGANVNLGNILNTALELNNERIIDLLLDAGANVMNIESVGNERILEKLIDNGMDYKSAKRLFIHFYRKNEYRPIEIIVRRYKMKMTWREIEECSCDFLDSHFDFHPCFYDKFLKKILS